MFDHNYYTYIHAWQQYDMVFKVPIARVYRVIMHWHVLPDRSWHFRSVCSGSSMSHIRGRAIGQVQVLVHHSIYFGGRRPHTLSILSAITHYCWSEAHMLYIGTHIGKPKWKVDWFVTQLQPKMLSICVHTYLSKLKCTEHILATVDTTIYTMHECVINTIQSLCTGA